MRALMRVVVSWLAVAGALVLAMATGGAAVRFMPSLDLENPALAQIPPVPGAPSHRLARRVVVVIVDGLRYDASRTMSFLATVRARGIDSQATSHYPSMSRPNYVSIATGVPPRWSGVRTNDYAAPVRLDSMMARARAAGMRVTYISQVATGPSRMFLTHIDVPVVAPFEGEMELKAREALARDDELVVLLFSDVDEAGHARGADSDEYVAAVKKVDGILARLLGDFDYEHDALVIVADHGHVDSGGHGGIEPEVMSVPLVLAGRGIRPGAPLVSPTLIDLAPTVSALLGLPAPGHSLGVTWASALELGARERDAIQRADSQRIRVLYSVMDEVRAEVETRAWSTRITRGALVLFGVAALVIVIAWIARRDIILIDPRVLLVGVPAFPLTFYGMVLVFEQFLSPSMIPAEEPLTNKLFLYGAVAAAVNLAMSWLVVTRRTCPGDRIAAATGLCLVGLLIALVPAGIAWTVAGPPFTVNLPQPNVLMLPPVTFAAVACFGVSAAVLVVAQYVVYMVRGSGADTAAESSRRPDSHGKHP